MKVLKWRQYQMTEDFFEFLFNSQITESNERGSAIDYIVRGMQRDLKFNFGLVFTFGVGIRAMYPVVENLIKNGTLNIEMTTENIVLICLAAITITYLEETGNKAGVAEVPCDCEKKKSDCEVCGGTGIIKSVVTRKDAQTILEECKLRGIGNGIIKKMVDCFKSVGNIVKILFKNTPYIIDGLIDMFSYASILVPTMNAISLLIGKYDLTMETFAGNFLALGVGVAGFLAKSGFNWLVNKLKDKLGLKTKHLGVPTAAKPYEIRDGDSDIGDGGKNDLIKEQ